MLAIYRWLSYICPIRPLAINHAGALGGLWPYALLIGDLHLKCSSVDAVSPLLRERPMEYI